MVFPNILGLIVAAGMILGSLLAGGDASLFFNFSAVVITLCPLLVVLFF